MRMLSLGAGGIGGYFGGRLIEAGAEVSFLVRPGRLQQLQENGLVIVSPAEGDFTARHVDAFTAEAAADQPAFDIVLLTCKAYDLDGAMDAIAPVMARGALVLPLLNGFAHLDRLNARFGRDKVLGGLAKIAVTLRPDGVIQHLNDWSYLTFGAQDGAADNRLTALGEAFGRTSVKATLATDVMARMWEKFVHLATVASMTCLMRASVGEIARTPDGTRLLVETFEILVKMAAKAGYPVTDAFRAEYYKLFNDKASAYTSSMLRDMERGGLVEADHIVGDALTRARDFGLETTLLTAAYTHLKAYEARRTAGRL